jgi:hypothetical protein
MEEGREGSVAQCPYYAEHTRTLHSREVASHQQVSDVHHVTIPYCRHKHSAARLEIVIRIAGGNKVLTCGGDLENKCQVPKEHRLDI